MTEKPAHTAVTHRWRTTGAQTVAVNSIDEFPLDRWGTLRSGHDGTRTRDLHRVMVAL